MTKLNKRQKNILIGGLIVVVLIMTIAYATFASQLNITGTSNITSNWDIQITDIQKVESKGATDKEGSPSYDNTNGLSATFNTILTSPGDYAMYMIQIENKGSLNAVLKSITTSDNTNKDINFEVFGGMVENDILNKMGESNNVGQIFVRVEYRNYGGQTTPTEATANLTVNLTFEQTDETAPEIEIPEWDGTLYGWQSSRPFTIGDTLLPDMYWMERTAHITKNHYLKHDIVASKITASYLCFVTDAEYCLQGGDGGAAYETNKAILQSQESWVTSNGGECYFDEYNSQCAASSESGFGGFSLIRASIDGHIDIQDSSESKSGCTIFNNIIENDGTTYEVGTSQCHGIE